MKQLHREINNISKDLQYFEVLELFRQYKTSKSQQIKNQIFNANVKLVFSICRKFSGPDIDDLEQYGFIGLLNAIESFDPEKKNKFSTYASRSITNEIKRGLKQVNNTITVPIAAQKKEDYSKPSFLNLDDVEIDPEHESDFDRQLFWIIVQQVCNEEETDILLKRFCYEEKLTLQQIANTWKTDPEKERVAPTQSMWKKLNHILNKLRNSEILKKHYQ